MENTITSSKIELMKKIIAARLTPTELEEMTAYAQSLIDQRPHSADSPSAD